ncbi:hypothetical protein KC217_24015, partial [Mycobacterium tuberculosis]|nr:hypothetical protein [Mycobacterium tuberculosis]
WSLTRTAAAEVLRLERERRDVEEWFRWAQFPDEMFFQTVVQLPGFPANLAPRVHRHVLGVPLVESLSFVGWSPRTLTE